MSDGFTPQDDAVMQLLAYQLMQQYGSKTNSKGAVTGRNPNGLQDFMQMLAQPTQGALLAGLFGTSGGFDPAAFQPVEGKADEFDIPNNPLSPYMMLGETALERAVAADIAAGLSPTESLANSGLDEGTEAYKDAKKLATDLFVKHHDFRSKMSVVPGMEQDDEGNFHFVGGENLEIRGDKVVRKNFDDSGLAKQFKEMGLPSPFEQFSDDDFLSDEGRTSRANVEAAQPELDQIDQLMAAAQRNRKPLVTTGNGAPTLPTPQPIGPSAAEGGHLEGAYVPKTRIKDVQDTQLEMFPSLQYADNAEDPNSAYFADRNRGGGSAIDELARSTAPAQGGLVDTIRKMNGSRPNTNPLNVGYGGTQQMADLVKRASKVQQATSSDKFRSGVEALKAQWRAQAAAEQGDNPFRRAMMERLGVLG